MKTFIELILLTQELLDILIPFTNVTLNITHIGIQDIHFKKQIFHIICIIYTSKQDPYISPRFHFAKEIDLKHMNLSSFVLANVLNYSIEIVNITKTPILKIGNFVARDSFDISSLLFFFQ